MSKRIVLRNQPCSCGSSDAKQIYEDGSSYCFSCNAFGKGESTAVKTPTVATKSTYTVDFETLPIRGFVERGIHKNICEFYGVRVAYAPNTTDKEIVSHFYPYGNGSWKIRRLPKDFSWHQKCNGLFGKDLFTAVGKRIIICEGEIDCLTVAEASFIHYKQFYPVVALSSSVMTASMLEEREFLRSFGEVVIMFDMDEAGEKAKKEAVRILGADKVRIAKLPLNDASDTFLKKGQDVLMRCIFDAERYIPKGIVRGAEVWELMNAHSEEESVPYPDCLEGVNSKTRGRRFGSITLWTSGTGCGKTTIIREDILHIVGTRDEMIGCVFLEDTPGASALTLSAMAMDINVGERELTSEEKRNGFEYVFGTDRILLLDHQGSMQDESIISKLEYMCLSGCKFLYIDHITILVSEGVDGLEGNAAIDKMMSDLLKLAVRYNVWIGLVSHLRKTQKEQKSFEEGQMPNIDDIKGSGAIKQISADIIAFARNTQAESDVSRNTVKIAVLKCRATGNTGRVNGCRYIRERGRFIGINNFGETDEGEFTEV